MSVRKVLERDRLVIVLVIALVTALAWTWLLVGFQAESGMAEMDGMSMSDGVVSVTHWSPSYAAVIFVMWAIMMVAMMLPSAAPVFFLYLKISTPRSLGGWPGIETSSFALGYLVVWLGFSLLATFAQWALEARLMLMSDLRVTELWLAAAILFWAGAWQLTPLKAACLSSCRSPIGFLTLHWKAGAVGAVQMGIRHGLYCLGCCWALMALLFLGGVMNFYWIAGIAILVAVEKLAPAGHIVGRLAGVVFVAAGLVLAAQALVPGGEL